MVNCPFNTLPLLYCVEEITQSWVSVSDMPHDRHSCASTADPILLFSFPTGCRFRLQMHSWLLKRASADVSAVFLSFVCICPHPCANEILRGLIKHTALEPQLWQWQAYPAPVEDMTWKRPAKRLIKKDGQRLGEREREKFLFYCCSRSLSFPLAEEQVSPALRLDGCLILGWHCGHHMRMNAWQSPPQ